MNGLVSKSIPNGALSANRPTGIDREKGGNVREVSLTELEVEIVQQVKKWRDKLIANYGEDSLVSDIDAGDAVEIASDIAIENIGFGVGIVGKWESHRRLNDGWDD